MIKKILKFIQQNYLIIAIIIIASFLRFAGINPGYPEHTDEGGYSSAYIMVINKNLDPGRYDYPAGLPILHYVLFKSIFIPIGWFNFYLSNLGPIIDGFIKLPLDKIELQRIFKLEILGAREINIMYWGRYVTATFGVGVVLLTYLLSKKVFGKTVGIVAAFLVAVNFRQVLNSHIGLPDIYNSFFLLVTVYYFYKIIKKPNKVNYLLAGIFNGLYFSIKFQTFGFLAMIVAHFISEKRNKNHLNLLISILSSGLTMILLNPYLFIKFEIFKAIQLYQLSKYGIGSNEINIYPISYLYHIGIGNFISILVVIGFVYCLVRYFKKSLILCLIAFQFMLTFIYLSRGGFYTRNFITITPILIIFASVLVGDMFNYLNKWIKVKWLSQFVFCIFIFIISIQNIKNSYIVGKEYSGEWNKNILSRWVSENIPKGSNVAAHSNTPLPDEGVTRSFFELDDFFSIDEFIAEGAGYAISNSAWTTNSFYWWMGGTGLDDLKHLWNKPLDVLEYSYPALALRELEQFNIYSLSNPWQAPDTDFLVAKLPIYKVKNKDLIKTYDFNHNLDGWHKSGLFWVTTDNLDYVDGALIVKGEPATLPSLRWESEPIEVSNWNGFEVDYQIKSEANKKIRTGYIFVSFYKNIEDAKNSKNHIGLRLSERNIQFGKWIDKKLVGEVPDGAKFMTINFYNYSPAQSWTSVDNINIYKSQIDTSFGGTTINPIHVDQNNLFLNSHGNL